METLGTLAVDTETYGLEFHDRPFCATIAGRDRHGNICSEYLDLEGPAMAESLDDLTRAIQQASGVVFHNAKFDVQKLRLLGLDVLEHARVIHDTEAIFHLLDEHERRNLKHLAIKYLSFDDVIEVPYANGKGTRRVSAQVYALEQARRERGLTAKDGYGPIPRDILRPYALQDAEHTLQLHEIGWKLLSEHEDLMEVYSLEQRVMVALLEAERHGVGIDTNHVQAAASEYGVRVIKAEAEIRRLAGDPELNPASPMQLQAALKRRGIKLSSTDKHALGALDDDLARAVLEYRHAQKIHQTYLVALLNETQDGVAHPWFRQHGTVTGRMSSGGAQSK